MLQSLTSLQLTTPYIKNGTSLEVNHVDEDDVHNDSNDDNNAAVDNNDDNGRVAGGVCLFTSYQAVINMTAHFRELREGINK